MNSNTQVIYDRKHNTRVFQGLRTCIGIRMSTKKKLDKNRAPGQCYDGFLCQLIDLWEGVNK